MPGQYTGVIVNFEINEKKPRGQATFNIQNASPVTGTTTPPDFPVGTQVFKLDEDSTETFAGMAAICAARAGISGAAAGANSIQIQVLSGAKDEIDTLKIIN